MTRTLEEELARWPEMPQTARWGECAYCVRPVPDDRLPKLPRSKAKRERALRSAAVACARCEAALARGDAPPAASRCGACGGKGRVGCHACGGSGEDSGEPCAECTRRGSRAERCGACGGRGMAVATGEA